MPEQIPRCMPIEIMQKWRALAEKRRANLIDLYDSGRWKHYYSETQLLARIREATGLVDTWQRLSTPPAHVKAVAAE
jgi:uncharacterized repeat protein (TIGR03809 family)